MSQLFDNKYPYTDFHELNLDWVISKVQELDKNLDELEARVIEASVKASKEYVDQRMTSIIEDFNNLSAEFTALENSVNAKLSQMDSKYSQFTNTIQAQITLMNQRIDDFRDELNASIIGVNARTDLAIEQNNEYILEKVAEGLVTMKVINYFTGENVTAQEMFNYLAILHSDNAISFTALADRNKTYTELAGLNITYTQLAMNGNILIV